MRRYTWAQSGYCFVKSFAESIIKENRSRKTKHIDDNANILEPKRTIYRIFLFITKWTTTVCEKNNEQRLKLFVVAAFGICRHHRFVHETNVVHPYRILGASTSKSDTSLKNQGTGLCLRFHTPREV